MMVIIFVVVVLESHCFSLASRYVFPLQEKLSLAHLILICVIRSRSQKGQRNGDENKGIDCAKRNYADPQLEEYDEEVGLAREADDENCQK